jgi:hypothetical protein
MPRSNLVMLLDFTQAVYLAEQVGCNVQLKLEEAQQIRDRLWELEEGFERLLDCYLEAEDECETVKSWAHQAERG